MNCQKCNCQLQQNQMVCPNCGTQRPQMTQQAYQGVAQPQQIYQQQDYQQQINQQQYSGVKPVQQILENTEADNEEVLINTYIGKNADQLRSGFSFCCFFLGVFYPLYRKMWLFSAIWYAMNYLIAIIFPEIDFISRIINLIAAIVFKELYMNTVRKRVNKIKNNNPGKSQEELIAICARKGGPTILGPILGALVVFTVAFSIAFLETLDTIKDTEKLVEDTFPKTEKVTFGDVSFEIHPKLKKYSSSENSYIAKYSEDDDACIIEAKRYTKERCATVEECVVMDTSSNTTSSSESGTDKINGSDWYGKSTDEREENGPNYRVDYYYTEKNNMIYGIKFKFTTGINDICIESKNSFIKTLKVN